MTSHLPKHSLLHTLYLIHTIFFQIGIATMTNDKIIIIRIYLRIKHPAKNTKTNEWSDFPPKYQYAFTTSKILFFRTRFSSPKPLITMCILCNIIKKLYLINYTEFIFNTSSYNWHCFALINLGLTVSLNHLLVYFYIFFVQFLLVFDLILKTKWFPFYC